MVIVVSGVSGVGKTTVGRAVAERLGFVFADADDFHPPENIEKMRTGLPLTNIDRDPWLSILSDRIDAWVSEGTDAVLACSALRRDYRARLAGGKPEVHLVHLSAPFDLIQQRLQARTRHFMPPGLLQSQFDTLEAPAPDEEVLVVPADASPEVVSQRIVAALGEAALRRDGGDRS